MKLAAMPPCLGGGDSGINPPKCLSESNKSIQALRLANRLVKVRLLPLQLKKPRSFKDRGFFVGFCRHLNDNLCKRA